MVLESSSAPSAQPNSGYNYVVTAQKPTAVRSSAVGHFSSPDDINLIISCVSWSCRMEPSMRSGLLARSTSSLPR